ncbi:MAG: hypothetical protein ACRC8Z_08500 [Empedobacter falsenii]
MSNYKIIMLRGIATINFYAANHTEAVKWYSQYFRVDVHPHYLEMVKKG